VIETYEMESIFLEKTVINVTEELEVDKYEPECDNCKSQSLSLIKYVRYYFWQLFQAKRKFILA